MGNRCHIQCAEEKDVTLYLQWNGDIKYILGYLDGAKRLLAELGESARMDLFNFGVIIQNSFGRLGFNAYMDKTIENNISCDNGNYIIDFTTLTIVGRGIRKYPIEGDVATRVKNAKIVFLDSDAIEKEMNDARNNDATTIAEVGERILERNLHIFN